MIGPLVKTGGGGGSTLNLTSAGGSVLITGTAPNINLEVAPGSGTGDVSSNTTSSVVDEVVLFADTSGKLVKRATATGIAKLTSGVLTAVTAPSGTIVGTSDSQTLTNKVLSGNTAVTLISGSGTLTLNTSGTATVPNATDTLMGKATTDTMTNKTFDADGTGNSITNIENADIKAAAAIAVNKLAALTASRAVVSDGSGFISAATTTATEIGHVNGVTSAIQTQLNAKQGLDATLTALAAYNTNGILTQTAADTFAGRTITGTANQITSTNGDGVSGNPILSIPTAFTLPGNMQLVENGGVFLDAALSADGKYSGICQAGTLGETVAFGEIVYLKASDSQWYKTDADAEATAGPVRIACCVLAGNDNDATTLLLYGNVRADSLFPTLTISAPAYLSTTAGAIQTAQPSGTDDVIRIGGYGNTADELFFCPSNDYLTHT